MARHLRQFCSNEKEFSFPGEVKSSRDKLVDELLSRDCPASLTYLNDQRDEIAPQCLGLCCIV